MHELNAIGRMREIYFLFEIDLLILYHKGREKERTNNNNDDDDDKKEAFDFSKTNKLM